MNEKINLYLEAERRGILPAGKKPLLDEARRRGLIDAPQPAQQQVTRQEQQQPLPQERTVVGELGRAAARTGRVIAGGIGGVADIPVMAARGVYALSGDNPDDNPMMQLPSETLKQGYDYLTGGAGQPQSAGERVFDTAAEYLTSAGGATRLAGNIAEGGTKSVLQDLGARNTSEAAATLGGAVASESAAEYSDNPLLQVAAGALGGGVSGGAAGRITPAGKAERGALQSARRQAQGTNAQQLLAKDVALTGGVNKERVLQDAEKNIPLALSSENNSVAGMADGMANQGRRASSMNKQAEEAASTAMQERTKAAKDYTVADARTAGTLAKDFQAAAARIRSNLLTTRRENAEAAYATAVSIDNVVPDDEVKALLRFKFRNGETNTALSETFEQVANNKDISFGLPPQKPNAQDPIALLGKGAADPRAKDTYIPRNSTVFLDAVYKQLNDRIARAEGQPSKQAILLEAKDRLKELIAKHQPAYVDAVQRYASDSQLAESLFKSGKKNTQIGVIADLASDKATEAAKKLFQLDAGEIASARSEFRKAGEETAFNKAVRSYISGRMDSIVSAGKDQGQRVNKIVRKDAEYNKLAAAMGKEALSAFDEALKYADQVSQAKSYGGGSQTAARQAAQQRMTNAATSKIGRIGGNVITAGRRAALANMGVIAPTEAEIKRLQEMMRDTNLAEDMTDILFDPAAGKEFIRFLNSRDAGLREAAALSLMHRAATQKNIGAGAVRGSQTQEDTQ